MRMLRSCSVDLKAGFPSSSRGLLWMIGLTLFLVFGLAQPARAQVTTVCSSTSLCLDSNSFLTGDYAVGGAVFNGPFVNGLQMGTINIPDTLQPTPVTVPAGAHIGG